MRSSTILPPAANDGWPFHPGEREAQQRAGVRSAGGGIRHAMPEQHRAFFQALPFVIVGGIDRGAGGAGRAGELGRVAGTDAGWPVAAVWAGRPGFVSSPDPRTLRVASALDPGDPASRAFAPGAAFGLLGIELHTRRRNRANGIVAAAGADGLVLDVQQSFGNCPQYIHPRNVALAVGPVTARPFTGLDAEAAAAIAAADTFFVATAARIGEPTGGVDVSHRGGPVGFVRVAGDTLTIPDYPGNRYFNTLGNLVSNPRAALLFIDFASGAQHVVQGTAKVDWSGPDVEALPGAERLWRLHVERGWHLGGG
jgi:predicted pyridoxine 5'-phosphate oxidase superfamily flavin-nucleotide-binding protein